jgi:hypothetical protein
MEDWAQAGSKGCPIEEGTLSRLLKVVPELTMWEKWRAF